MPQNADQLQQLVPEWTVRLNGSDLAEEILSNILAIEVEQYVNGADAFMMTVNAWDVVSQELKWIDDGSFAEGSAVEILIGYGENMESVFIGEIVALRVLYGAEMTPVLYVEGYDKLHRFRRGKKTRTFTNIKDSELAQQISQEMRLQAEVEDSEIVHAHLFQYNQSDIDFLQERARSINYELDIRGGVLSFRKAAHYQGKSISLSYGDQLRKFDVRLSTLSQVNKVVVKGWNIHSKEAIVGLGQVGDEVTKMDGRTLGAELTQSVFGHSEEVVLDRAVFDQAEADQMAKAIFNHVNMHFIKGRGECVGNASVRAGEVVEINNLGRRLSGFYYITSAHHIIDSDGYITRLTCRRSATT